MDQHGLSMIMLHRFLDTARAYLNLARPAQSPNPSKRAVTERRSITRLQSALR